MSRRFSGLALLGDAVHAAVVIMLCGRWEVALGFFAACGLAVLGRRLAPASKLYLTAAILGLTLVLLICRRTPVLFDWSDALPGAFGGFSRRLRNADFGTLGLSYCYLRTLYALVERPVWSFWAFFRYYFFAPTFFSGPVMTPAGALARESRFDKSAWQPALARAMSGVLRIAASSLLLFIVPLGVPGAAKHAGAWPVPLLWLGAFASGIWLYLNFSGFSEIYIGLASLLGVRPPENFDNPYGASTITAFWQRWHISLGNWLRALVYTPLSRTMLLTPAARIVASLMVPVATMVVCGAWHMVAETFLVWGLLHGIGLSVHAAWTQFAHPRLSAALRSHYAYRTGSWLLTHAFVALTWVFFLPVQGVSFAERLRLFSAMTGIGGS